VLPDPDWFTRDLTESNLIGKSQATFTYTPIPSAKKPLTIQINPGTVSYVELSEKNKCENIISNMIKITYVEDVCTAPVTNTEGQTACTDGSEPVDGQCCSTPLANANTNAA